MSKISEIILNPKVCMQIGIYVNIALTVFKLFAGIVGLSKAMLADALESFADIIATFVAYVGIIIGARPADEEHPYGHGNAETIAAGLISLLIVGVGCYMGISAIHVMTEGQLKRPLTIALVAAVVTIAVKELLFRYTIKVGNISNNPAVIANAWHHRSDAYSSIGTLIGIAGARLAFLFMDPLAGLITSVFIIKIGVRLVRSNIGIMMDERPHLAFINNVRTIAQETKGVKKIDSIKVHRRGSAFTIDLEIAVDNKISVDEGHKIAVNVRNKLLERIPNTHDVMVHVNPAFSANTAK